MWTWGSDKTVGFVLRRMAHETAVHRVDAERAAGRDEPLDAELASDGVDEFLFEFLRWARRWCGAARRIGAPALHGRRRRVAGASTTAPAATTSPASTPRATPRCAVPAADLLLVLWRRLPLDAVDVVGDRATAERLVALTNLSD